MTSPPITTFRQELKVLAVLALFLIGLELYSRRIAPHLDSGREHIHQFDEIITTLPKQDSGAFLGNSLLLHGLDQELLQSQTNLQIIKITPVATAALDWEHIYERYFHSAQEKPTHLFIGFVAHHINDSEPVKLRRLSRHFATWQTLPQLWANETLNFHQKTQSVFAHSTALIGDQPAHRERILDYFIDWYRLGLRTNQDFVTTDTHQTPTSSFKRFTRLINACRRDGIQLWLIPMPQPEHWELDPQLTELIKKHDVGLLDARAISGMTPDDFSDGYHLGESGAEKFTQWIAQEIATLTK